MGLSSNPDMEDQSVDGKGCKLFLKCFFGNLFGYEGIDIVEKMHYLRFEDSTLTQSRFSYVAEGFDKSMNQLELDSGDFSPVFFYRAMNQNMFP